MGIFSGLFRSWDKPKDSCDSPSFSYFFGCTHAGKRGPHGNADHRSLCLREPEKTGTASTAYSDTFWNSNRNRD